MSSNYLLAWAIYLASVAMAQLLLWRLVRKLPSKALRQVLQLSCFAILITPVRLEPGSSFWVPAFMAALMESIDAGPDAALNRLWPILAVMLLFIVISLLWHFVPKRRES